MSSSQSPQAGGGGIAAHQFDVRSSAAVAQRKSELVAHHEQWVASQPELREVLHDFMQALLIHKPDDALGFMKTYFEDVRATADVGTD